MLFVEEKRRHNEFNFEFVFMLISLQRKKIDDSALSLNLYLSIYLSVAFVNLNKKQAIKNEYFIKEKHVWEKTKKRHGFTTNEQTNKQSIMFSVGNYSNINRTFDSSETWQLRITDSQVNWKWFHCIHLPLNASQRLSRMCMCACFLFLLFIYNFQNVRTIKYCKK